MTVFNTQQQGVPGQTVNPGFGVSQGQAPAPATLINLPANMSVLEAMSRGILPRNALVNTINGLSPGGNPAVTGSDPLTVDQAVSNGNGVYTGRGASIAPAGALNTQIVQDGFMGPAQTGNGSVPKNTSALTEAPVSAATLATNVALFANQFGG